jgi:hypothetical protein
LLRRNTDSGFITIIVNLPPQYHLQAGSSMRLKKLPNKTLVTTIFLALVITPLFIAQASSLQLTTTQEYNQYVRNYINTEKGNYTQLDKPVFPVMIYDSQIQIGANWTITCPLQANHNYHIYCYGKWVSTSSTAKTDYNIYVYDPTGNLESSHTEAAGFPEHLGTTVEVPLFTPTQSGNYSFVIKNDARGSAGAQQATFMIVENLDCNRWYSTSMEGKDVNGRSSFHTCWTYEFITNESKIEVYLKIPQTLDMYEARLYLMNNPGSPSLDSYPLPWEPGLYGNQSGVVGGYNFENDGYRGVSYESCGYKGQPMFLNYTSPNSGMNLYQLVLIGEEGSGDVQFIAKTDFAKVILSPVIPVGRVFPNNATTLSFSTNGAAFSQANLFYSTDNWLSTNTIPMDISNKTCNATIPGQPTGTIVQYQVNASDILENQFSTNGNYTVKTQPTLTITLAKDTILLGQNVTITGTLTPSDESSTISVQYFSTNTTDSLTFPVAADGTFTGTYQPAATGTLAVLANAPETQNIWGTDGPQLVVTVKDPPIYVKYGLYILIGLVVACAVGGVVYFLKFRNR